MFLFSLSFFPGLPKLGPAPSIAISLDRPSLQPHPQDLNSLVQQAETVTGDSRTPVCQKCNNIIRYEGLARCLTAS